MKKFLSRFGKGCIFILIVAVFVSVGLFGLLKRGITIDHFSVANSTYKQLSLSLGKKFDLTIGEIIIDGKRDLSKKAFTPAGVRKAMAWIDVAIKWFDSVSIKKIAVGRTAASFVLRNDGSGLVSVKNPAYSLTTVITYTEPVLTFKVRKFASVDYHSQGSGQVRIDIDNRKYSGDIKVDLARSLPLELHVEGDRSKLRFEGKGNAPVLDIRPVVELFALDADIQPWITDYLKGDSFTLDALKGTLVFASPEKVFNTLYAKASVQNCEYSFESKLPSIKARSADVVFERGVLKIYPHHATYSGIDAGRSRLDIDFSVEDPVLNAYIRTKKAGLGDDIISLLDFYDIHLPFKQTKGKMDAVLKLSINLVDLTVGARGEFKVDAGTFVYKQKAYTLKESTVLLVDDDVTIKELNLSYQDLVKMQVKGKLDILSDKDELAIAVSRFDLPFDGKMLTLDTSKGKVRVKYKKNKDIETFSVAKSRWKFGTIPLKVDGFSSSVKAANFSGILSKVRIGAPPYTQALVSGAFNISKGTCNLMADIQGWDSNGIKLEQKHLPLTVNYSKSLKISSVKKSKWIVKDKHVQVDALKLAYMDKKLTINRLDMDVEGFLKGALHGEYDPATGNGYLFFDKLAIDNAGKNIPDFAAKKILVKLLVTKGILSATIPELGISYQRKPSSNWAVHVADLQRIAEHSDFLQRYDLNRGTVEIWQTGDTSLMFSATITYPYPFLVKDNKPVNVFVVKGMYDQGNFEATINDDIHLHYIKRMRISSSGVGYNFSALRSYLEDHLGQDTKTSDDDIPAFDLQADRTVLFLNASQNAPADQLQIHSEAGRLTGRLAFGKGKAELDMNTASFTLMGQDFGEKFLDGILKESQFIGGKLSFYVSGLLTKFKGVAKIDDGVVKNGAVLNNIMAFINTVPDLITFSFPGYSLEGLPFSRLYTGFAYDNHAIDITSFVVESNTLDMTGTGRINQVKNSIKMDIDLISKTKKYISKIPLIGYILVGDTKQPTVTLNVEGKLDDPEVSTSVYQEIVKTPFDILLRALSLPSHILKQLEEVTRDDSTTSDKPPEKEKN